MLQKKRSVDLRILCVSALLCAVSVAVAWVCKTYFTFVFLGSSVRFTLENLPIMLSGIWFGPLWGFGVGLAADLLSTVMSQYASSVNPFITLGAAMCGCTAGLISRLYQSRSRRGIVFSVIGGHAVGSGILKTTGLYIYHFYAAITVGNVTFSTLWLRIPTYLIIAAVECYLALMITKNRALSAQIERMCGR